MAYDSARGYSVLFGGQKSGLFPIGVWGGFSNETWIYEDSNWRKLSFWRRPAARCGHSLTFDEKNGLIVLFGGIDRFDRSLGDTWLFDGGSWRRMSGPGPTARRYAAFAFDPGLEGCVLQGGAADDQGKVMFGDTWIFQDYRWTCLQFQTDARDDHGIAYHRRAEKLLLLDGINSTRGLLGLTSIGWQAQEVSPLHPRHQCSPLAWDNGLEGIVLYGGEEYHGGSQFDFTLVLR
jgi:hypothetical protein